MIAIKKARELSFFLVVFVFDKSSRIRTAGKSNECLCFRDFSPKSNANILNTSKTHYWYFEKSIAHIE
jgi:hypothetical protein